MCDSNGWVLSRLSKDTFWCIHQGVVPLSFRSHSGAEPCTCREWRLLSKLFMVMQRMVEKLYQGRAHGAQPAAAIEFFQLEANGVGDVMLRFGDELFVLL